MAWELTVAAAKPAAPPDTEALFRAHGAEVSRWVRALAGPEADVEDLVQDVFVAVHRARRGFRGDSALTTWLFGITSNLVKRHRRVQKVRRWLGGSAVEVAGKLPGGAPLADDQLAQRQARLRVHRVLDQLSHKFRTALILFELEGKPAAEIAELFGVTPSVVFVWLTRARAQFYKRLEIIERTEGVV
ncbi:MAG: RNA polymerase sigma factor [Archangium sp.]|nr:RNA polymerase sigma factor [Archangium sp.]